MPVTFNSNNNYSVDIISESDVNNPSSVKYTSISNTPFVEIKITPTDSQNQPVLASNLKIDSIISEFIWNAPVQYNHNGICAPPPPPHNANSSLQHLTGIGVTSNCQTQGFNSFFGNSNEPQQGPYIAQNDTNTQANQIAANGVSWSQILLIEIYEGDQGGLINDDHSPEIDEQFNHWLMWTGPVMTQNGLRAEITTNIYPKYVKAFVYLSFGSNGLAGLTTDTTLNLDIDEVEPTYDCTDPNATNYNSNATIDDGSCAYGPLLFSLPPLTTTSDLASSTVYNVAFMNGFQLNAPIDILILDNLTINIPSAINGLAPYDYEMNVADTVNASPSTGSSGPPAQIVIVDENASTFNNNTGTYDDIHFHFIPLVGNNTILGQTVEAGSFNFGKVVLQTDYTSGSITSDVVNNITVTVTADDDNGDQDTSTISLNMTTYYPFI